MPANHFVPNPATPPPTDKERRLDPHDALWADPDPAVDAALAAALPTAKPSERTDLIRVILERGELHALTAAVEWADLKDPEQRDVMFVAAASQLDGPIRRHISQGRAQGCRNALTLIRRGRLTRLAYLLTELIRHGSDDLPDLAAAALVSLAEQDNVSANEKHTLCQAVDDAVAAYDRHRHPGILDAFLRLQPSPMPKAAAAMVKPQHPATKALHPRLSDAKDAWDRRALLPLAGIASLQNSIKQGLINAAKNNALNDTLTQGHLISELASAHMLSTLTEHEPLLLTREQADALSPDARRWLPALWSALPLKPGRLLQLLDATQNVSDRASQLAALRTARTTDTIEATGDTVRARRKLLVGFALDGDEPVARCAARALDHDLACDQQVGDLAGLAGSLHASVRATAGVRLGPALFEKLWKNRQKTKASSQGPALRALSKLDPNFDRRLLSKLNADAPQADPCKALRWVEQLGHPEVFAAAVTTLAKHQDTRVMATAAATLVGYVQPETTALLTRLTEHADARVRANAIESLSQHRWPDAAISFTQWADDEHARPRANAIRGLLTDDYRAGLRALSDMLRDGRPDHRRSGLWLARIAGLIDAKKQNRSQHTPAQDDTATTASPSAKIIKAKHAERNELPANNFDDLSELVDEAATVTELLSDLYRQTDDDQGAAA